jgi:hypothetical protein
MRPASEPATTMSTRHRIACAVVMLAALLAVADGEPFDYFANSWGLIGLKDYRDATRVTPANQLLLANKTRLQFRIGPQLAPPSRAQTTTLLDGWLPVARCEMLDLSRTANTDPFTAPFGAKKPGKFLFTGLRGDPWHLNMLGVTLRPVRVERIVFRDLGTPVSPVLAAVTLEQ